jgi:sec-independent protein translocase protein TatC
MALLKRSSPAPAPDPEGRMPLMEHLRELRNRVFYSVIALVVGVILGWIVFDPVWAFIKAPFCETDAAQQLREGTCSLTFSGIFQSFFLTLKVSAMVGIVVSSPVWLYQIWAFVTPALYRTEKRYSITFMALAIPLFLVGAVLAYLIMDTSLALMLGFAPADAVATVQIDDYVDYVLIMLVIFGISFELPLLLVFLNIIGVLPRSTVTKHRRTIIFAMFAFGAVITPGGDPFAMIALAVPMVALYFAAEGFMYLRERRRPDPEDFSDLDDEEASPLAEPPLEEPLDEPPLTEDSRPGR